MTRVEECAVWWMDARDDPRLAELLTSAEQQRAASMHGTGRYAFVAARALIRLAIADMLGERPHSVVVAHRCRVCGSDEHGQPTLPGLDLSISISHSGGRVGVALAPVAVGIDIEDMTARTGQQTFRLIESALTPAEQRAWASLPSERRTVASIAWWTRKESVLKAVGWGLAIAPDLIEVTAPGDRPAVTQWALQALDVLGFEVPIVHLYDLQPGPGYVGALASVGCAVRITQHVVDPILVRVPATTA